MKKLNLRDAVVLDWETLPITKRPQYPPEPVGLAYRLGKGSGEYLSFGHITGNNYASYEQVRAKVAQAIASGRPLLFHNSKFDAAVIEERLGIAVPWDRVHDTLPMLFLDDPRAASFALKPAAERLLNEPPDEKDAMVEWLIQHAKLPGRKLGRAKGQNYAGAYVAWADVGIGGPYAVGDVDRTYALADLLLPSLEQRGMLAAYERERKVLAVVYQMEKQGVRLDLERLSHDVTMYRNVMQQLDNWLRKRLRAGPSMNLDSDDELTQALVKARLADAASLGVTKTGKLQANKEALARGIKDKQVSSSLRYRAALSTCLGTFMEPWLRTAEQTGGLIYTEWHTTRNAEGEYGTKTGRLSSTPNFQNIPNEFPLLFKELAGVAELPSWPFELPPLPFVRCYIIPMEKGHVLIDRDYSQQEPRIAAHYEEGPLLRMYEEDPWADVHDKTQAIIHEATGVLYKRKPVKNTGLGVLYGMGGPKLAWRNDMTVEDSIKLLNLVKDLVYPGIKQMYKDMKAKAKANEPIYTWGGREYYCEEAKIVNGKLMNFDYKLVNLLIQGSAADCTKEALLRYDAAKPPWHSCFLQVHDQIVASVPADDIHSGMKILKETMESVEFDVPMLSEGKWSNTNWGEMRDYDVKGKQVYLPTKRTKR